jgi:thioredoxin-related protein
MNFKYLLLGFLFFIAGNAMGQNKVRWTSWDSATEKIKRGDKKFIVYLYYDGCKWCRFMEENTFNSDHIARFINHNFYAFHINALSSDKIVIADKAYTTIRIGKYDFHELATEMLAGNMSFPAIIFLNEQFKKIATYDQYIDVQNFEMLLSFYAGDHHKRTMWRKYANNYCRDSHFNTLVNGKN